ncbi:MAG: hypothetical protein FWG87_14635 [Defluviitaleaceae bacterium]|nr:hypothetical protein [Defluviitaleaceae bacterium]
MQKYRRKKVCYNTDLTDLRRFTRILSTQIAKRRYISPRANPPNPRKSVKSAEIRVPCP